MMVGGIGGQVFIGQENNKIPTTRSGDCKRPASDKRQVRPAKTSRRNYYYFVLSLLGERCCMVVGSGVVTWCAVIRGIATTITIINPVSNHPPPSVVP